MPEILRAFIESASPPQGQGNAYFKADWKIALTAVLFLPYLAALLDAPMAYWVLAGYSIALVGLFAVAIFGFKEHMAYESNPFDFVKVELLLLFFAVVSFGCGYVCLSNASASSFNRPLGWFDGLYFSVVTVATVGYGDITPVSRIAKVAVVAEISFGLWFFVTVVPVAVADQAERIRHFRAGREKLAKALKASFEQGGLNAIVKTEPSDD